MSPLRRLRRTSGDEGFSLVEILVSITIFGVVAAAVLPLLLAGVRGGTVAKLSTQAKGLAQERLEQMRNLPFHIAQQNGDYLDVLDIYFRDLNTTASITAVAGDPCASRRYVTATLSYECTAPPSTVGVTAFGQKMVTRFMKADGTVVTPRVDYRSWELGKDGPSSTLLDVVITTSWKLGGEDKSFVLRSRIARSSDSDPLITSRIRATAVKVTGATDTGDVLQFEAGLLSADGSKATASSASATAAGAYASRSSGSSARGAELTLSAPPDAVGSNDSQEGKALNSSCALICFGKTKTKGVPRATVSAGVPQVGVNGTEKTLSAELSKDTDESARGFKFSNTDLATAGAALGITQLPLVSAGSVADKEQAVSDGHLDATATGATSVTARVAAQAELIQLFRTATAPAGVVQIKLTNAALTCVDGAGGGVTADWLAEVRVHTGTGTTGYTTFTVAPGGTALPVPSSVTLSDGSPLSRYVADWSGLVGAAGSVTQAATSGILATIPAVVTILTTQTRAADTSSVLNIAVGSLSCAATDNQ